MGGGSRKQLPPGQLKVVKGAIGLQAGIPKGPVFLPGALFTPRDTRWASLRSCCRRSVREASSGG